MPVGYAEQHDVKVGTEDGANAVWRNDNLTDPDIRSQNTHLQDTCFIGADATWDDNPGAPTFSHRMHTTTTRTTSEQAQSGRSRSAQMT